MNYINTLLFAIYPYIALSVFFVGSLIRYDRDQYTWKTSSSQIFESRQLRRGSILFHIGIIMILLGHFVGLLTPTAVWHVLGISASFKQLVAMLLGGVFGLVCLAGLIILIRRRLTNPRVRANTNIMDFTILWLLLAQLVLGLLSIFVSAGHMDGQEMLKLMSWAQSIVTFQANDAALSIASVHWIYKLHVWLGMTLFLVFPFSRLVHIWSVPVGYLNRRYQLVRARVR
ncbi:respiratory nitrate reductase subunit gamma [Zooshikella marina]|uniref:respiratory nitrate reductase subunit gamma n=1 Tax=Zooshikella ganghwensis TaxID=202772 RepID=UPI001BAEA515|nr:respiratory nitrate reductase subunit gamma [Zooshikella ganghwensis]MBU2705584.1 respiratory nitrate reductase subunit gamma [Zooshikella ganghwensis]